MTDTSNLFSKLNFFIRILIYLLPISFILGTAVPDILISIISIIFLVNLIFDKNYYETLKEYKQFIILGALFYFYILLSSLFSEYLLESIQKSLPMFRFLFFSLAMVSVLKKSDVKRLTIISSIIIALLIFDLIYQFYNGINLTGNEYHYYRLSGFFGDELIAGAFILKLIFPIIVYITFIYFDNFFVKNIVLLILIVFLFFIFLIIGERAALVSFLIISSLLLLIYIKDLYPLLIILPLSCFVIFNYIFSLNNRSFSYRIFDDPTFIISNLTKLDLSMIAPFHSKLIDTSIEIFQSNIIFGTGFRTFRFACRELESTSNEFLCSTHPHNLYFEVLSDLGLLGLILLLVIIFLFLFKALITFIKNNNNYLGVGYILSILTFIQPIQFSMSTFHNWNTVILFFMISSAIILLKNDNRK